MGVRNPKAKWVLPDVVDPVEHKCFKINVPDEVHHIAAFKGALLDLCSATQWADDPYHKAKDVAAVWRDVYVNMVECNASIIPVACPADFQFGDQHDWHPIHANGIDYAIWTGAGWRAGYQGTQPANPYWQIQIYHDIPIAYVYSYTVEYTCLMPVTIFGAPDYVEQGPFPPGLHQVAVIAVSGNASTVLRVGMTTNPTNVAGSDIAIYKVIANIGNTDGACH